MTARPYILAETTWKTVKGIDYDVAVLPWGATEAHNYHLPYGTDNYEASYVAAESARKAFEKEARVAVLPTIPFGVNTGQLDIPLTINMNPSTEALVLGDIARSLEAQGIRKLVILNSHGGNDFRPIIRELQGTCGVFITMVNWWNCIDPKPYFDEPGDHAGEVETSVMMEITPDLVLPLSEAGSGAAKKFVIDGLRNGVAWAPRNWRKATEDTGSGDPSRATRDKGVRYLEAVTDVIADFLVQLAQAEDPDSYE
jgi:creatinine amidohydrolase